MASNQMANSKVLIDENIYPDRCPSRTCRQRQLLALLKSLNMSKNVEFIHKTVLQYLLRKTSAQTGFFLLMNGDSQELICHAISDNEIKVPIIIYINLIRDLLSDPSNLILSPFATEKPVFKDNLTEEEQAKINKFLGTSFFQMNNLKTAGDDEARNDREDESQKKEAITFMSVPIIDEFTASLNVKKDTEIAELDDEQNGSVNLMQNQKKQQRQEQQEHQEHQEHQRLNSTSSNSITSDKNRVVGVVCLFGKDRYSPIFPLSSLSASTSSPSSSSYHPSSNHYQQQHEQQHQHPHNHHHYHHHHHHHHHRHRHHHCHSHANSFQSQSSSTRHKSKSSKNSKSEVSQGCFLSIKNKTEEEQATITTTSIQTPPSAPPSTDLAPVNNSLSDSNELADYPSTPKFEFTQKDADLVHECFQYTLSNLLNSAAYEHERRVKEQTQKMLSVAKNIFSHMTNLNDLLLMIMREARSLTDSERCSVFLVDEESNELVAKVFDGLPTCSKENETLKLSDGTEIQAKSEIRIPISQGIAGKVATSGKMMNIKNAYDCPLFYRGVDDETGFKTRNILCFPIQDDSGKTVGVAQLCNKKRANFFTKSDEEIAKAFSIYCCISITHSLMYKKVDDAQHRSLLANELMMYHMQVSEENVNWLTTCNIPPVTDYLHNFDSVSSIARNIPEENYAVLCLCMLDNLGMLQRWRINRRTLAKFIFMVQRGYRDVPYHNWTHAFTVAHFVYTIFREVPDLIASTSSASSASSSTRNSRPNLPQISELEAFALFIASLCHDIDHRGTTNLFQEQSNSVLSALYSSQGSVLERHHFNQTMCLINTNGCNIFENLDKQDYSCMLDLIRKIILSTDLMHHIALLPKLQLMVQQANQSDDTSDCNSATVATGISSGSAPNNSKPNDEEKKQQVVLQDDEKPGLLLCLLMTSADLSDQMKHWSNARSVARLVCNEFFQQGDLEKSRGRQPNIMMDRDRASIPEMQIGFIKGIIIPLYATLTALCPKLAHIMQTIDTNQRNWSRISEVVQRGTLQPNSEQIFTYDLDAAEKDQETQHEEKQQEKQQ